VKPLAKDEPIFSVNVDTEAKFRHLLERLAHDWDHVHKGALIRWLSRDIRADFQTARKPLGIKSKFISRHLRRPARSDEVAVGVLEKRLLTKLRDLPDENRLAWFRRRYDDFLKKD